MSAVIITGTDTGVGKTIFSAGLTDALGATYWKPVQAGLEEETDTEAVVRLTGCRTLPEAYRLQLPASPHLSAQSEVLEIDSACLVLPQLEGPLVVEGAGGLMVPLTGRLLLIDQIKTWNLPVILVCRTRLGTINHTLLSLEALRSRGCTILGVVFIGDAMPDTQQIINRLGQVRSLGRLPIMATINRTTLAQAFRNIDVHTIREAL